MDQRAKLDRELTSERCAIHGNGRELMHIKVATLGAETLIKVYV
jgi:hypothetical protein